MHVASETWRVLVPGGVRISGISLQSPQWIGLLNRPPESQNTLRLSRTGDWNRTPASHRRRLSPRTTRPVRSGLGHLEPAAGTVRRRRRAEAKVALRHRPGPPLLA